MLKEITEGLKLDQVVYDMGDQSKAYSELENAMSNIDMVIAAYSELGPNSLKKVDPKKEVKVLEDMKKLWSKINLGKII